MGLKQIFTIQKLYISFEIFSFSMVMPFLFRHFSFLQIMSGCLFIYLSPLPLLYFAKRLFTKKLLFCSFVIRWLGVFVLVLKPGLPLMYLYFILNGLIIFFFWAPYNIRYFTFSHRMNRATSAGHFIIVGPILNTFIPFISGLIISTLGPWYIVAGSTVLMLVLVYKTSKLPQLVLPYTFKEAVKKARGLNTLKFIQGMWEAASMLTPLYALSFIQSELAYGSFLSYLGLVGVVATLFVTKFSDAQHKRMKFFFPLVTALGLVTLAIAFVESFALFAVTAGMMGVIRTITYPFFFAIILDRIHDKTAGMIVREFMLNSGRVAGVMVFLAVILFSGSMRWGFLILGSVLLVYPVLLLTRNFYVEEAYNPLMPVALIYNRGRVAAKVYAHGGVEKIRHIPESSRDVIVRTFNGTRWVTKAVSNKSYHALRSMFSGDAWILRKVRRVMKK